MAIGIKQIVTPLADHFVDQILGRSRQHQTRQVD